MSTIINSLQEFSNIVDGGLPIIKSILENVESVVTSISSTIEKVEDTTLGKMILDGLTPGKRITKEQLEAIQASFNKLTLENNKLTLENNSSKEIISNLKTIISNLKSENLLWKSIASVSLVTTSILGGYAIWKHYQQKQLDVNINKNYSPDQETKAMGETNSQLLEENQHQIS